ncbi:hypothetical protein [Myroides sp. LJL119]
MKTKTTGYKKILFALCTTTALIIYLCQRNGLVLASWINNYVNDFLTLPIVLSISVFLVRKLKKDPSIKLSISLIIVVAIFYSVYFEYYLPPVNPRYTKDPIDILLYFLGGFSYYFVNKTL